MTDEFPPYLKALFGDSEVEVTREYLWQKVTCDAACGKDYTNSSEQGGFLFGSYAYCPTCAKEAEPKIKRYKETHMIRARCPDGMAFSDWVRELRGKGAGNFVTVYTNKPKDTP